MTDLIIPLLIVLVLVLMWRGPKTLPKLGAAFGRGVKEAKIEAAKAQAEIQARTTQADEPAGAAAPAGAATPVVPAAPVAPAAPPADPDKPA